MCSFYADSSIKKPKIIAEVGCNHKGNIKLAKTMIDVASIFCGADIIKFQKRNNKELLTEEEYNSPHPVPENSYGKTYGEHREFLEFNLEQHKELKRKCEGNGVIYSSSVWDITSAKEIISLNPKMIKIPSACNLNYPLIHYIIDNYYGEIHLSLGMTSKKETEGLINYLYNRKALDRFVLYACTSNYPVSYGDIYLLEIKRLKHLYGQYVRGIGFSGHHVGYIIDIAATTIGVDYIERHFTLDRSWKGTDHSASLDSYHLHSLVKNIENLLSAWKYKDEDWILKCEVVQRKKLKKIIEDNIK